MISFVLPIYAEKYIIHVPVTTNQLSKFDLPKIIVIETHIWAISVPFSMANSVAVPSPPGSPGSRRPLPSAWAPKDSELYVTIHCINAHIDKCVYIYIYVYMYI